MKPRRAVVLINAAAGTAADRGVADLRAEVETAFAAAGVAVELRLVAGGDLEREATRAVEEIRSGRYDAVIAGGGDGSLNAVAGRLVGTQIPFGVLPLGTLNHFCRDLGIPADLAGAISVIAEGRLHTVDTGEVNGRMFLNNSSIGLYPYMVLERERTRRRTRLPKWLAMIWASLRVLRHFPLRRLSVSAEGRTRPYRSPCVFVGNNEYTLAGRELGTRRGLKDGLLSLYIADQQTRAALVGFALRLVFGRVDPARDLVMHKLPEIEVLTRRRRRLLVARDGEIETLRTPLRYRTRPGALQVYAPVAEPSSAMQSS